MSVPSQSPQDPSAAEGRPIELPVDEVILLEDRAHVIRRGTIEVGAGTTRLRVADVAPVISDRTLCAGLRRPGGGGEEISGARVQDLRIRRQRVVRVEDRSAERRGIERELRELHDRRRELRGRQVRAQAALVELGGIARAHLADIGVDASWGVLEGERWRSSLAELRDDEAAQRATLLTLREELEDLGEEIDRLQARLDVKADVRDEIAAELVIEIVARAPGRFQLQVDYIVPGACWRPYHRAEVIEREGAEPAIEFTCEGCVWQRTGERWDDAQLIFSTERPSLGTDPPTLSSDLLEIQRRREVVEVELREQEIQTTGLGGEARKAASELPGIDDGGEALELRASRRADVPSDGQPHRVPLFSFTGPATLERVLMAELAPAVILRSTQVNGATRPILAGPVDLIRGGGFVGRTSVLFIAPGERFALGLGPDGALRVLRSVDQAREESRMLSSWTGVEHTITLRLSNLGDEARAIKVSERVPVSEIDKVKIEVDARKTTGGKAPDEQGIVSWDVRLGAYERQTIELRYTLRKHGDVSGI
ncbi:MAG: DUF4139 domain-containing protein [Myxococcales bacterium]|nr:DUF4139 domain-containing protein [Myxococcales bacterium]MCB9565783.1 DUF4139 domain-containing protein [Myxococcales bacterium]